MQTKPTIVWPDGSRMSAETWEDLEHLVMKRQWDHYESVDEFRQDMAERAIAWSRVEVDTWGSSYMFFCELERAQMLIVVFSPGTIQA